jgi:hypothetical protein
MHERLHHVSRDMDLRWTLDFRNVLLIRDPFEAVASYVQNREKCEPDDIGLPQQGWLMELWDEHDVEVPILDARDFLGAPEAYLRRLCDWLGIPFTDRMLSWPPGPRPSDGVWAKHWYASVWASTGFEPWHPREVSLSDHDAAVAEACRPIYAALYARRVRVRASLRGTRSPSRHDLYVRMATPGGITVVSMSSRVSSTPFSKKVRPFPSTSG